MLDLNREDDAALVDSAYGFWSIDIIFNQYLLSLGKFASLESLGEGEKFEKLVYVFFFMATFYTQLTLLNMLIAIMGDSFDYATENRERFAIKTKLEILSALAPSLPQIDEIQEENTFLIVVSPSEVDECEADESWQGTINKVLYLTKKSIRVLEEELKKRMGKQQSEIMDMLKADSMEISIMKGQVGIIRSEAEEIERVRD